MRDPGPDFITGTGQPLHFVHRRTEECALYGCAIHSPSNHDRVTLPLHWSGERRMLVRVGADGSWLTDPDEIAWRRRHPEAAEIYPDAPEMKERIFR